MIENSLLINDDLFLQTVTCPLKYYHITENHLKRNYKKLLFRQRNKLHVRNAIAYQFQNCRYTSDSTEEAQKETEIWLKQDSVAICGAVIRDQYLLTRVPLLVRNGRKLTIIQVHGKLRKRSEGDIIQPAVQNRSTLRYLLKAAYRMEVIRRKFPTLEVDVQFCFPNKHFKSSAENLHLFADETLADKEIILQELSDLFSTVEATAAVHKIHQKIPDLVAHKSFENLSVVKAIENIRRISQNSPEDSNVERHGGCKYCEFRQPEQKHKTGCWERFFTAGNIKHPEKHIFELIGQGNSIQTEKGTFYQEQAELSGGFGSFDKMREYGGPAITILQRRNLQILQAKNETVPGLWIKPGVKILESLEYPLHFIDFEAATFPLPMKSDSRPYNPVYFQFSCNTLYKSGEMIRSEWLDEQHGSIHPHVEFVKQLGTIPDIFTGTIMQYSPFEKQGVNRLIGDFNRDPETYRHQIQTLEEIRQSENPGYENRFFDLSRIIRDYYFNKFFRDSLGLKQVLSSILRWDQLSALSDIPKMKIGENIIDFVGDNGIPDPYKEIQNPDFQISDGSAAMNAWLALKNDLLTSEEKSQIPQILKKYCALDSFALYVIFKHLEKFTGLIENDDLIKF